MIWTALAFAGWSWPVWYTIWGLIAARLGHFPGDDGWGACLAGLAILATGTSLVGLCATMAFLTLVGP